MNALAKRNVSLDLLKVLMAYMVVGIHCKVGYQYSYIMGEMLVDGIFRIAVPIFFIINGYFLCDIIFRGKLVVWVKRILAMYLIWMLIYSYFWFDFTFIDGLSIRSLVKRFIIGYAHLWYVASMIPSALLIFAIYRFRLPALVFSIALLFFCGVFIQYAGNYHLFDGVIDEVMNKYSSHRNALFTAFPFMLIGFLIRRYDIQYRLAKNHLVLLASLGVALGALEITLNVIFSPVGQDIDNMIYLIVLCPVVFLTFLKGKVESDNRYISEYASAIYFIHFAVLLSVGHNENSSVQTTFLVLFLSSILAVTVIYLNKRVKILL